LQKRNFHENNQNFLEILELSFFVELKMKIKQVPEDFIVNEIIEIPVQKSGDETYFWLTKRNWTTERAINEIARKCGVSYRRFKFAGTKDKFAVTKQAVSAFKVPAEKLNQIKLKDISTEMIGSGEKPISLGTLEGNHFEIIIRDLTKAETDIFRKNFAKIKKNGFKNFFGEQRFGKGNTHLIGKAILKGDLEKAAKEIICFTGEREREEVKQAKKFASENWGNWQAIIEKLPKHLHIEYNLLNWLINHKNDFAGALRTLPKHIRKLYVHAYQSWLWNSALAKSNKTTKKEFPIPGFGTKLGNDAFSKTIKELLEKDNLALENFGCARMPELAVEGEYRNVIVKPANLKINSIEDDELNTGKNKVHLSFDLTKGSYATVLVEALFGSLC
jgi:tRNA pseudouridine13 synthase